MVNIQAELNKKEGDVDKRRGLLGSWADALKGDLFRESDSLKTYTESYAQLAFVDGSKVVVNPQTVAIIRQSRIDKLNKRVDTEISLEDGSLLAKRLSHRVWTDHPGDITTRCKQLHPGGYR